MSASVTDPALLTATELLEHFSAGTLSPVEVTEAALARIEAHNPRVTAFCLVDPEVPLEQARASQQRWHEGRPLGLLDGVPTAIKDIFLTRGWPTRKGSVLVDPDQPWEHDAPSVAALRRHGAVFIGKTTTPELAWKGVTDSPLTGVTGNPWDPSRTAGGSSGGSSAAVVLGMAPLALGTDGGGSIRIPAGFSGHVGLKPTYGRVPLWPVSPYGTLAHAGPMTWTVADTALLLDALGGHDPRDWTQLPTPVVEHRERLEGGVAGLRVAYSRDLGFAEVDPEIGALVDAAAAVFEELGAEVTPTDPGFEDPLETFTTLWNCGAAAATRDVDDAGLARMDPGLVEIVEDGRSRSAVDYVTAMTRRGELGVLMGQFHQRFDLLVTPTLPIAAFAAGREVPEGSPHRRWTSWTPFSYPFNLTQQPAASVPCGFTAEGLPVGLQVVGPRHGDDLVLRAAHAYQSARPLTDRRPA